MRVAMLKYLSVCFLFFGCASYRSVQKGSYDLRIMSSGCCGCMAYYYNIYEGKKRKEQFIIESVCGGWQPTKYFFEYGSNGKLSNTYRYIAVYDSTYTVPLSASDKLVLPKLDVYYKAHKREGDLKIDVLKITGFRRPDSSEVAKTFKKIDK